MTDQVTPERKREATDEWLAAQEADAVWFHGLDEALLGVIEIKGGPGPILCYDRERVISIHQTQGMSYEEAVEFVDFNVTDCYAGPGTPAFLTVPWREGS